MTLNTPHLGVIYHACASNLHTKSEVPSFIHSKDMMGPQSFQFGDCLSSHG